MFCSLGVVAIIDICSLLMHIATSPSGVTFWMSCFMLIAGRVRRTGRCEGWYDDGRFAFVVFSHSFGRMMRRYTPAVWSRSVQPWCLTQYAPRGCRRNSHAKGTHLVSDASHTTCAAPARRSDFDATAPKLVFVRYCLAGLRSCVQWEFSCGLG